MSAQANCPSCGAVVNFNIPSSLVVICPSCRSVVARTDRGLESLGVVAELSESRSPLKVGLAGQFQGLPFRLVGRAQMRHATGGVWDEWYAAFGDGRWGWVAEAMGRFFLTFRQPAPAAIPGFDELTIGQRVAQVKGAYLMVSEKGVGEYGAAEGEMPFRLAPGARYNYADLSSDSGVFGTLDFGEAPPLLYLGYEVTLEDLGLGHAALREAAPQVVAAARLNCPHCGGALELHAPDQAERVCCPYCASLLDVNQGNLVYLKTLSVKRHEPILPLGRSAGFEGVAMTVIGFMVRSCRVEDTWYPWEEYLLYHPRVGYRWLVRSDDHWTWVRALNPGEVRAGEKSAYYQGKRYKCFQRAPARADFVLGEFFWKVEEGEQAETADFVRAPYMLSQEVTRYGPSGPQPAAAGKSPDEEENPEEENPDEAKNPGTFMGEVNWSRAEYVPVAEIERKFGLQGLPRPRTVGPCQPFPHTKVYRWWGWVSLAALLLIALVYLISPRHKVFEQTFQFAPVYQAEGSQTLFTGPLDLQGHRNIRVLAQSHVENNWVFLEGEFTPNGDAGPSLAFALPIEHYSGVEDGEAWTEGSDEEDVFLNAPEPGSYSMRWVASWGDWQKPLVASVTIEQGVPNPVHILLLLAGVSAIPLLILLWHARFNKARWSESMYGS